MERTKKRTQSLMTQMVRMNLSANETNGACVFPSRPRPASRSNRPDTYQRLPISSTISLAKRSRSIHWVRLGSIATDLGRPPCVQLQTLLDCKTLRPCREARPQDFTAIMPKPVGNQINLNHHCHRLRIEWLPSLV